MLHAQAIEMIDLEQGSQEWLNYRKTKITATDAPIIIGANHYKTKIQLYHEKKSIDVKPLYINERMQRGRDLEPVARALFNLKHGVDVSPRVAVKDWAMASLDGINQLGTCIVEIKCPGEKDHSLALQGKIPDMYFPQLQHQMYVCDAEEMFYFSFDGVDGVTIKVKRDEKFLEKLVAEEKKFYDCLINNIVPEPSENDYIERNDTLWTDCAMRWKSVTEAIKQLEKEEEELRKQLVFLSGESNTKGGGISLCQVQRKGNVDYTKIPELKGIDLDKYRKESITSWRLTATL